LLEGTSLFFFLFTSITAPCFYQDEIMM